MSIDIALCREEEETEHHLFGSCNYFKNWLKEFCLWWNVSYPTLDLDYLLQWGKILSLNEEKEKIFMGTLYVLMWLVWNQRNNKIFRLKEETRQGKLRAFSYFWIKKQMGEENSG